MSTFFTELLPAGDGETAGVDDGETVTRDAGVPEGTGTAEIRGVEVETGEGLVASDESEAAGVKAGAGLVAPDESEAAGVKAGAGLVAPDESEAAGVAAGLSGIGVAEAEERDSSCASYSASEIVEASALRQTLFILRRLFPSLEEVISIHFPSEYT